MKPNKMKEVSIRMNQICMETMKELSSDFVALATYNNEGKDIRWKFAAGNRNEKYKQITVRYGKGIAGQVMRSGSPMVIQSFPEDINGKATDYPIMLAEQLVSCIAVPVQFNDKIWGVLLAGHRIEKGFTEEDRNKLMEAAKKVSYTISK
ncbi:GAF domain-containing protein [Bacillus carboniphilus]|uniref:GAF domain-containing protein n=1 Tax=Bacillus carboniphilus TaxID=86663 RepID=A0ABN0W4G8_9BACI